MTITMYAPDYTNLLTIARLLNKTCKRYLLNGTCTAPVAHLDGEGKTADGYYMTVTIDCHNGLHRYFVDCTAADLVTNWNNHYLHRLHHWNNDNAYYFTTT